MAHTQRNTTGGHKRPRSPGLVRTLHTPGHARSQLIRNFLAIALVITAALVALSGMRENPEVVVFARDVEAGAELRAEDLTTIRIAESAIPSSATFTSTESLHGRVITAPAAAGEFVTELRVLGDELTSALVPDGHMVPLKLAEPDLIALLHHGDTVNIVTSQEDDFAPGHFAPVVIAEDARVIATSVDNPGASASPATILIALPADQAQVVASASLSQPLTVVITGGRASVQQASPE